jgi:UDP-N-acetylglucosamine 2-epimerase (non-hydrolysing)
VDDPEVLRRLIDFFVGELATDMPLVWPVHPRSRRQLEALGLLSRLEACANVRLGPPIGYLEMLRLNMGARLMLTDSGGLQEECCVLGTPCLTLRWNTERPVTLAERGGTCFLVGNDPVRIREAYRKARELPRRPHRPNLWDGHAAERIADFFAGRA